MYRNNGTPPEGCISNSSNFAVFNMSYSDARKRGMAGFAIKYALSDVWDMWNSYCHACAYTRLVHKWNMETIYCGHSRDFDTDCQSRVESKTWKNRAVIMGEGIFYKHWHLDIRKFGILWRIANSFHCWNSTFQATNQTTGGWTGYTRWRTYHPWSQVNEGSSTAAYLIHVQMNALKCPYPCRGPDVIFYYT